MEGEGLAQGGLGTALHLAAQGGAGTVQAGLDQGLSDAEALGGFGGAQSFDVGMLFANLVGFVTSNRQ